MSISSVVRRRTLLLAALFCACLSPLAWADTPPALAKPLRIGITLHPYYSYVKNIVGDKAEVVPLIPAGFNPHAYEPRAEDIKRIGTLDVIVLNGVGHDDFADRMIEASEKPDIAVIEANQNVPLLAATGTAARGAGKVVNPHTFLSISASIAQVNNIARELGKLDPANAKTYTANARAYGKRLRQMRADALAKLTGYLIEKALAVDNVFVWLMLFSYFAVPANLQRRVLIYGVLGAIVLRTIMIFAGSWLVSQFSWILYLCGAFLLFTGIKMALAK